jgi:hypothetical protein
MADIETEETLMHILKAVTIVLAWTIAGIVASALIAFLPGALDFVNDAKWGRVVGSTMPIAFIFSLLSAVLVASKKRALGLGLTGFMLLGYIALDVVALVVVHHRG